MHKFITGYRLAIMPHKVKIYAFTKTIHAQHGLQHANNLGTLFINSGGVKVADLLIVIGPDRMRHGASIFRKLGSTQHPHSINPAHGTGALGLIDDQGKSIDLSSAVLDGDAVFSGDTLIMKDWQAKLSIRLAQEVNAAPVPAAALPSAPVPSLLRDFSAPVFLDYDYSDDQLLHLLAHDTDPFNRWEAGQRLMLGLMLRKGDASAPSSPSGNNLPLGDQQIVEAFRRIAADPGLDNAYKAAVLTLPSEAYVAERVLEIDPSAIRSARNRLRMTLATALKAELHAIDQALAPVAAASYSPDPLSTGRRSLANLAQHWLGLIGEISPAELLARFERAGNMTDRLCALQVLVELDGKESKTALKHYLAKFSHHALALDKWFTVQATLLEDQCLDRVRSLLTHPDFDATNPNRLRSLLGAFFHQNLPGFHRADGAGYELWAEQVIEIDQRNSQLASRMARALDRWARFEPVRRAAMKKALARVAAEARLSPDVREVISKALG